MMSKLQQNFHLLTLVATLFGCNVVTSGELTSSNPSAPNGEASASVQTNELISGGSISANVDSTSVAVNLTSEGSADWVHWYGDRLERKAGVTAVIGSLSSLDGRNVERYANDPRPIAWTDGTPSVSTQSDRSGVYLSGSTAGFTFAVAADTTPRTLVVHAGGWSSGATMVAQLSDGSSTDFVDVVPLSATQYDRNYTLTYHAASAGQTLKVSWKLTSGSGNVTISAAAVSAPNSTASGGVLRGSVDTSPSETSLTSEGSFDWLHFGDASLQRKSGVSAKLSGYTLVGSGSPQVYANDPRNLSWADGTPSASGSNRNGVYVSGVNNGFALTAPADNTERTVTLHVGGWNSTGVLSAKLSDQSSPDFVDYAPATTGQYVRNYRLSYRAAAAGQKLSITWTNASGTGNVTLAGAALDGPTTTGGLTIGVSGVPGGAAPAVVVTGPASYSQSLQSSQSLTRLTCGSYQIVASPFVYDGSDYSPTPAVQVATVSEGAQTSAAVSYVPITGALVVAVAGVPGGVLPNVHVAGPSYATTLNGSSTLAKLTPGSYQVTADDFTVGSATYRATLSSQVASVSAGSKANTNVAYVLAAGGTPTSGGCGSTGKPSGDFHLSTTDGSGAARDFEIIVPANYSSSVPYPLTFVYHGLNGNTEVAKSYGIQNASGASANGIFVFPMSADPSGNTWNDTCAGKDVRFFDNILSLVQGSYCINRSRVYVAGFSWGCDQATALVACRGDRIRAASVASCSYEFSNKSDYRTYRNLPSPVTVNTAVRFTHDAAGDQYYSAEAFSSTSALFRFFNGCSSQGTATGAANCIAYSNCTNPVVECSYPSLGHTIPANWGNDSWTFLSAFQ
jgi:poly(3-hydroxybutyrate) depolymerase